MPLIRTAKLAIGLQGNEHRRRLELQNLDVIRHYSGGMECSIRSLGLGKRAGLVIRESLLALAEEGVDITLETEDAYKHAMNMLCVTMTQLFGKANTVSVAPSKDYGRTMLATDYKMVHGFPVSPDYTWFPMAAEIIGAEIVILFRVASLSQLPESGLVNDQNSLALGIAEKDLSSYFPELATYVSRFKSIASDDSAVSAAFRDLMQRLQPKAVAEREVQERIERYKNVQSFGTWA